MKLSYFIKNLKINPVLFKELEYSVECYVLQEFKMEHDIRHKHFENEFFIAKIERNLSNKWKITDLIRLPHENGSTVSYKTLSAAKKAVEKRYLKWLVGFLQH